MRVRSSIASSLVFVFLLSIATPLTAAPRNGDDPRWQKPIDRIVRVVKVVKRFFGVSSDSDVMIPPLP
ncbi:MAG: hypothetical protein M3P06_05345 [Acidobacteriota bacterium]|nr:hypothetical protein [Acidobacteriota bacterium]